MLDYNKFLEDQEFEYTPEAWTRMATLIYAIDNKPPVKIDENGLIWKDGKVIINTFKEMWKTLQCGLFYDRINIHEKQGTYWTTWITGSHDQDL